MRQKRARVFIAPKTDFVFRQLLENERGRLYMVSAMTGIPVEIKEKNE